MVSPAKRGCTPLDSPKGERGMLSVVINNDGSLDELRAEAEKLWEGLQHSSD